MPHTASGQSTFTASQVALNAIQMDLERSPHIRDCGILSNALIEEMGEGELIAVLPRGRGLLPAAASMPSGNTWANHVGVLLKDGTVADTLLQVTYNSKEDFLLATVGTNSDDQMALSTKHILFAGPSLSGKLTSLRFLEKTNKDGIVFVRHNGDIIPREWLFVRKQGDHENNLVVSMSCIRASRVIDVLAPDVDECIKREIDFLGSVDGILFVVDSQSLRMEEVEWHLDLARRDLQMLGRNPDEIPVVFQVNKRDLPGVADLAVIQKALCWPKARFVESIALKGEGVREAFEQLIDMLQG